MQANRNEVATAKVKAKQSGVTVQVDIGDGWFLHVSYDPLARAAKVYEVREFNSAFSTVTPVNISRSKK